MAAYTYRPSAAHTASNYRLIGNPHQHFYPSRNKPILLAVNHITAGIDDYDGDDKSAEATLSYSATTATQASYHGIVDSDSIHDCLPDTYTAWAQGVRGYNFNSPALSLEIGKRTTDWTKAPAAWVEATLRNAAKWWAPRVKRWSIPLRLMTNRDEIQRLINANQPVGFTEHWRLDPGNRSDAGRVGNVTTFPWSTFFRYVREELGGEVPAGSGGGTSAGDVWQPSGAMTTKQVQQLVGVTADGDYGPATTKAVAALQQYIGTTPDGLWGPETERIVSTLQDDIDTLTKKIDIVAAKTDKVSAAVWRERFAHPGGGENTVSAATLLRYRASGADVRSLAAEVRALAGGSSDPDAIGKAIADSIRADVVAAIKDAGSSAVAEDVVSLLAQRLTGTEE